MKSYKISKDLLKSTLQTQLEVYKKRKNLLEKWADSGEVHSKQVSMNGTLCTIEIEVKWKDKEEGKLTILAGIDHFYKFGFFNRLNQYSMRVEI